MSATCPNCKGSVAIDAPSCPSCRAEFGEHAAWRPVVGGAKDEPFSGAAASLALGATLLSLAAWAFVLTTALSRSYTLTGDLQMFRWAIGRALAGFGPQLALLAFVLGMAAVVLSRRRYVPWLGLALGGGLWLIAQIGAR